MTAANEGETLRLHITEPEEHTEVLEGQITSKVVRGGFEYHVFSVAGSNRWLAIRARHAGEPIEGVFSGSAVIVNVTQPEKRTGGQIPPVEHDPPYQLEFFAIGVLRRVTE